ncbi:1,4-beta-N-acetylmuramidase [Bifidobacterium adolescentis]|nr:1,4-beta-N-acetylmuramidase [Bifidobacterium adolescentis]KAB5930645.1 1,4-beta-N-acetylmuramidase [Bifidobacterium adolescentis]KAB5931664.1 1,4-beta-N-acetylmuramidase [Bifidobacterium adolescentis]KAB5934743.1 1,4-beta-N-acetylmuramidase [Bifidobacterium adolescentis]KAB5937128.1 1,4-beta-N-acetylmuramidase [Bifidobacterium adolescentis]
MISPKSLMKIATTASVVAMTVSVAVVPAYAMQDIAIEDTPSSFAATVDDVQNSSNSMPDNPNATLPETVSENISDDSTVVSENLAVTPEGDVQNIETGETVTDAQLVGTQSQQPDPLAKTNGESFIPVSASNVKDAVEQSVKQSVEQSSLKGGSTVRLTKFESNEYGAHWGTYNGTKAFFDYRNNLFVQQAKGVIDVSSWQGDVDWAKAKADGVEGAIIRLGYGWGNYADAKAQRNINECKRLGIPFGIYWYSYAYDANCARAEGNDVAAKLRQMGVSPNDLKYPVYYDLEKWTWAGHTPPTNPNVYSGMADAWYGALQSAGYKNLGVYSYTSYLQGPLNNSSIYAKTRWVAQYGAQMGYNAFGTNDRGWQYTSSGHINGISGSVDMNAFGSKNYAQDSSVIDVRKMPVVSVPDGNYFINLHSKVSSSVDIPGANASDSIAIQLYSGNGSKAQQFKFSKQSDGSYVITNVNSDKALDVRGAAAGNNSVVQQYAINGTNAQRWFIRDSGAGYYLQSALGNWVLDLSGGNTSNGTAIRLYAPNGTQAQRFVVSSSEVSVPVNAAVNIKSAGKSNLVFDVPGASTANSARIQLYAANGTNAQKFRFQQIGNGTYNIVNVNSGKVLDVYGASASNGAVLQQYDSNGTVAQQWTVRNYGDGKISLMSVNANKAIDVPGANYSSNVALQLYSPNDTAAQQWIIEKSKTMRDRLNEQAAKHRQDLPDGTYSFGSKLKTNMKMDVYGASRSDCANVQLWTGNGTNAQRWRVSHDDNGYVTLTSANSDKALDVYGASTANGANAQQYASNGTYAQKWIAIKNSDGSYTFQSALAENKVLDVSGASTSNGANVQLYAANGTNAQKWVK